MSKVEELIAESKLNELLKKKDDEKVKKTVIWVLAIVGAVAAVAAIAYAYIASLHRIIWKISKKILMMISMIISVRKIRFNQNEKRTEDRMWSEYTAPCLFFRQEVLQKQRKDKDKRE